MKQYAYVIGSVCLSLLMTACQNFNTSGSHSPLCKEMRSQMMFSGNTANQNLAFQQRVDQAKLSESYHDEGCI